MGKPNKKRKSNFVKNVTPTYSGKNYGKGSRNKRRDEDVVDTIEKEMSRSNPVTFYTKFKQFADDSARLPFSTPLGSRFPVTVHGQGPSNTTVAGLMRLAFAPTVGVSADVNSPLNRSSINFYARIRSIQKAFGDYDHQDLTMMILAIDSAVMFHALGRRLYGIMRDMTPLNRYYPRAIVAAHNVQFTNSQKELQDFRAWLNQYALQIEQYAIPDNIELINRHSWMCEGLYVDSDSTRAQTFMWVPTGFWKYNNTSATGSQLDWVQFTPQQDQPLTRTIEEFEAIGDSLIAAMTNDADFATIAGDLYAYYGNGTMKLPYVTETYTILPKYDKTVLSQIENATIAGYWDTSYTPVISQNSDVNQGAILFQPRVDSQRQNYVDSVLMNFHWDSPSSDDVIEASRVVTVLGDYYEGQGITVVDCGSEILQWIDIYATNPATGNLRFLHVNRQTWSILASENESLAVELVLRMLYFAQFDWAPRIEIIDEGTPWEYMGSTWDIDNVAPVQTSYIATMHEAALYSLFNVAT